MPARLFGRNSNRSSSIYPSNKLFFSSPTLAWLFYFGLACQLWLFHSGLTFPLWLGLPPAHSASGRQGQSSPPLNAHNIFSIYSRRLNAHNFFFIYIFGPEHISFYQNAQNFYILIDSFPTKNSTLFHL